jgi:hypothetical protein
MDANKLRAAPAPPTEHCQLSDTDALAPIAATGGGRASATFDAPQVMSEMKEHCR